MTQKNQILNEIIKLVFPEKLDSLETIFKKYPKRQNRVVTRVAPSPTWKVHLGTLFVAVISKQIITKAHWKMILRIDDTDKKREVKWSVDDIVYKLDYFDIKFDEWVIWENREKWYYWPYFQSKRLAIYRAFLKNMLLEDKAYICFADSEYLENIKKIQAENKIKIWYYWHWAKWRYKTLYEVLKNLKEKKPFTIRLKSNWDLNKIINYHDIVKWNIKLKENILDIVLQKNDWFPSYHFASVIDDALMWVSHIIRWDEWLPSLAIHIELFDILNFKMPVYAHISPLRILENNGKVKLSKRKHKQASLEFYMQFGYPKQAVLDYLFSLINSDYNKFKKYYKDIKNRDKNIKIKKLQSNSGALIDFKKLDFISKNYIASLSLKQLFEELLFWSKNYNLDIYNLIQKDREYFFKVLSIEREVNIILNLRKDLKKYSDFWKYYSFFFVDVKLDKNIIFNSFQDKKIVNFFEKFKYEFEKNLDSRNIFFDFIKEISNYKKENIIKNTNFLRYILTWNFNWMDLYQIIKILWNKKTKNRINLAINI